MSLREQTLAIAVIGVTGSGKSTFINLASGSSLPINSPPGNGTTELESSTFSLDRRTVTLIDTPGFDDTTPSVLDVLKLVSDHFSGLYSQGVKLAGVIYMHYLAEGRMGDPSRRNFLVFRKFCGDTTLRDVLIVTSKRPDQGPNDGETYTEEHAYKDEFFSAVDEGARVLCHDGSRASAHTILRHLINRASTSFPAQGESLGHKSDAIDAPVAVAATTATTVNANAARELADQVGQHATAFGELCHGIDAATHAKTRQMLQEKAKDSLDRIEYIRHDLEKAVTNLETENSRLEDGNRRYKRDATAQSTELQLRTRLLGEERRTRELVEVEQGRVESKPVEDRALWGRQRVDGDTWKERARPTLPYDKFFVCGAVVFALVCVSRFAFSSP